MSIKPKKSTKAVGLSIPRNYRQQDIPSELIVTVVNKSNKAISLRPAQRFAKCSFHNATSRYSLEEAPSHSTTTTTPRANYAKSNQEEAITCALRVAVETQAVIQAKSLSNDEDDQYTEFMRSSHERTNPEEVNKQPLNYNKLEKQGQHTNHPVLPQDRVNSSLPQHVTINHDFLIQATGFHKSEFLIKHFNTISTNSTSLAAMEKNPKLDEGETATIRSNCKNSKLSDTSHLKPGEVYNMDIVYGPTVAIAGIKYALILIDRKTKQKLIYGLKNLTTSL